MDHGKNLDLIDEEKDILELSEQEETSQLDKKDVEGYQLVGKVLKHGSMNVRVFKATMAQAWKMKGGLEVRVVEKNLFTYCFSRRKQRHGYEAGYMEF